MEVGGYMAFTKYLLLLFPLLSFSQTELQTKQALNKVRYLSPDGKVTYYQKSSGELQISTNYNFATILKLSKDTQFYVTVSDELKQIAIEADSSFFSAMNLQRNRHIYTAPFGKKDQAKKIGEGLNPQLHLKDQWASYFNIKSQKIELVHLNSKKEKLKRRIKLNKHHNQYFIPLVYMLTANDVIFTDINKHGISAVLIYSFIDKKFSTIYKAQSPGTKLEICNIGSNLYIGEFPHSGVIASSQITQVDLYSDNYKNVKTLYSSENFDLGNMLCEKDNIYFIKTTKFNKTLQKRNTEVAQLDLNSKKVTLKTKLDSVTQLLRVGNMILTTSKGKYYIVTGKNINISDQLSREKKK